MSKSFSHDIINLLPSTFNQAPKTFEGKKSERNRVHASAQIYAESKGTSGEIQCNKVWLLYLCKHNL
jgi:hypothetical protein